MYIIAPPPILVKRFSAFFYIFQEGAALYLSNVKPFFDFVLFGNHPASQITITLFFRAGFLYCPQADKRRGKTCGSVTAHGLFMRNT